MGFNGLDVYSGLPIERTAEFTGSGTTYNLAASWSEDYNYQVFDFVGAPSGAVAVTLPTVGTPPLSGNYIAEGQRFWIINDCGQTINVALTGGAAFLAISDGDSVEFLALDHGASAQGLWYHALTHSFESNP